jgi:hypothetical protein
MPWSCCGAVRLDSEPRCPACGADKQKWTARFEKTRVFRVKSYVWIEVQLHDVNGAPCAGEPYRLWLPDGELRAGTLDAQGVLREPRLAVAREHKHLPCRLELPGLDAVDVLGPDDVPPGPDDAWVALRLVDDLGQPQAGEDFRLWLPNGEVVEGVLDEDGAAYVERIPPGGCRLWLPGLDAADLLVEHEDVAPPAPERAWLSFDLVDALGAPQAGLAWKATLADGTTREGTLDDQGRLLVEDVPAGSCRLELPDVDAADWSAGPGVRVAGASDVAAPAPALDAWLAATVVDALGAPARGAAWKATLPDGATREGTLDDAGQLVLEGIPAGACRLEFPDIDGADFARDGG